MVQTVLLTGGCGYIGSHTAIALLDAGYTVIIIDSYGNSYPSALQRINEHASAVRGSVYFINANLERDRVLVDAVFVAYPIDLVIHFAAWKSVDESVRDPLKYYRNNLGSLITLLEVMESNNVHRLIFSSSATVYAPKTNTTAVDPSVAAVNSRITETDATQPSNPYGWTKLMGEQILKDTARAWSDKGGEQGDDVSIIALRYFNPAGGVENPKGSANNLFPVIREVLDGRRLFLSVYGTDWPTRDGTGERDYVHVMDVAEAHVSACQYATTNKNTFSIFNIGTGRGTTVLEIHKAMEEATGRAIPMKHMPRRVGDVASVVVDPRLAELELQWKAQRTLRDMINDNNAIAQ